MDKDILTGVTLQRNLIRILKNFSKYLLNIDIINYFHQLENMSVRAINPHTQKALDALGSDEVISVFPIGRPISTDFCLNWTLVRPRVVALQKQVDDLFDDSQAQTGSNSNVDYQLMILDVFARFLKWIAFAETLMGTNWNDANAKIENQLKIVHQLNLDDAIKCFRPI